MESDTQEISAHFGFRTVEAQEKQGLVREVFSTVAGRYDLMNDLMSGGLHGRWKDQFVRHVQVGSDAAILDLAGGTGVNMQVNSQSLRILRELGARYADVQRVQSFVIKVNRGQVFVITSSNLRQMI